VSSQRDLLDLLIIGAGPTGIAVGAEARRAGLDVLVVDRGPFCAAIQAYPTDVEFFTTRERLEIADIPFTIPEAKPSRRQALAYYRAVVERYAVPLALYEEVLVAKREGEVFLVESVKDGRRRTRRARAVVIATGYFFWPKRLGVPGEDLPWVHHRYVEPYPHFSQDVVVVGAGNTAAEAALDLWRNGARVTIVHRGPELKRGVKYWLKPDLENRIEEGSIPALFGSLVCAFRPDGVVEVQRPEGPALLPAQAAFVLIGYLPDVDLQRRCGVEVDPETLVPRFDPETCESNVPGLYIAGTLQAGRQTDRIFIENSRDHAPRIVAHLLRQLPVPAPPSPA
jgi:thioredoxin reductase (NADPH)